MARITVNATDAAALGAAAEQVEAVDETGRVIGYFSLFVSKESCERTRLARDRMDTISSEEVWEAIREIDREEADR